jgi:hypothetical protein
LKRWKSIGLQVHLSANGGIHSLGFDHDAGECLGGDGLPRKRFACKTGDYR